MRTWGVAALVAAAGLSALATRGSAQVLGQPVGPAEAMARATLVDASGAEMGHVVLRQTPDSGVLLDIRVRGLEPGTHAVHIHETGSCEAPDFTSAGGHYAPRRHAHGALHPRGMHAGDMLNLHVPAGGEVRSERIAKDVSLLEDAPGTLFDDDGSAIIVHAGADDYHSQPSGDAGPRVLCGVIRP